MPPTTPAVVSLPDIFIPRKFKSVAPQYPTWLGAQAVVASIRILDGAETFDTYVYSIDPITEEEIDQFYRPDLKDSYWVGSILPEDQLQAMYGK